MTEVLYLCKKQALHAASKPQYAIHCSK